MSDDIQYLSPIHDPILRSSPFFNGMSDLEYNAMTAFLERLKVRKGDFVIREGDSGDRMFILVLGELNAFVSQPDGTQRHMFDIKPGDFFGEMSIIANETRSATLTAETDSELLVFKGFDFYRFVFEYPMIGVKLLKAIRMVQNTWLEQTSKHLGDLMRWGETARRRAVCDELTGLYNRHFLEESVNDRFKRGSLELRSFSLLMMDLDKIHEVNDSFGIKTGDTVFISTADILRSTTRPGDICARFSGDEFAVLFPETKLDEAMGIAERIREAMASRKIAVCNSSGETGQTEIIVRTSIGIASAPAHADSWENLYLAADYALHRAKELGRNRVEIAK
jgi:diguanylate cyclase (GGDEF)-like protein